MFTRAGQPTSCIWERGLRGDSDACSALCQLSVTSPATHKQSGPFWCSFLFGWVCVHSGTLWVSPTSCHVSLGVSWAAASTPTCVFNQWFDALFPRAGTLGLWGLFLSHFVPLGLSARECATIRSASHQPHGVRQLVPCWPAVALPAPFHNSPPYWVLQPLPCHESSLPGCVSPPVLPVCMNVSSLTFRLSDFPTVWFSVSSGCFLFLNCCCPSFGCARRHSVSTYASILAG